MRVPNSAHLDHPWRIHGLLDDFRLEDVWVLPEIGGSVDDFGNAVALMTDADPANAQHLPTRALWRIRDLLGRWFNLGEISSADGVSGDVIPGTTETSIGQRLPDDLRGTAAEVRFKNLPFRPIYLTHDEFAAEVSNKTVHGVMHLGWLARADGTYHGQMAVYVKPRGMFGSAYMAFIRPFRYLVVYPALERQLADTWSRRWGSPHQT